MKRRLAEVPSRKQRRAAARLAARQRGFDSLTREQQQGRKRPGSLKQH